jgi:transcriptional regulator with XRE-family HTH domain
VDERGTQAERLRRAREARGWSQARLASETGVGVATISRAENGWFEPRQETVRRLATALGVRAGLAAHRRRADGGRGR